MSARVEELLGKLREEALVRGVDWLREIAAKILGDEEIAASDTEDPQPCAKRARPHEHRSPSPVPRTQLRLRSPDRDPPGAAARQCPASEVLCPGRNPFGLDSDLRKIPHAVHYDDEDLRTPFDTTSQCGANSGPSDAVAVTVSVEDDGTSDEDCEQNYLSPVADSQPKLELAAQPNDSSSYERVPDMPSSRDTAEGSDAARIERLLRSCSAAAALDRQNTISVSMPVSFPASDLDPCLVWILGNTVVTSALEKLSVVPDGRQLGFPRSQAIIRWLGTEGLTWDCVRPSAARYSLLDRPPDILVVHAGGDDVGTIPIRDLIEHIKYDLMKLKALFSGSVVVWSEIVKRHKWPQANNMKGIERARIKVNKAASKFLTKNGVVVVRHRGLEYGMLQLFEEDGVRLNLAGHDIWCMDIKEGIDNALKIWQRLHGITTNDTDTMSGNSHANNDCVPPNVSVSP